MKKLTYLILHCTATPEGRAVTADEIRRWHTAPPPQGRGWSKVGYSDMIHLDGHIENLRSFNPDNWVDAGEITNGARGMNTQSRHIVYVGGTEKDDINIAKDTRTPDQEWSMSILCWWHVMRYPDILILGHNEVADKACPSFDTAQWLECIGIPKKNIYGRKEEELLT